MCLFCAWYQFYFQVRQDRWRYTRLLPEALVKQLILRLIKCPDYPQPPKRRTPATVHYTRMTLIRPPCSSHRLSAGYSDTRGTRIDHNCLRVNFVTNVVRSCNGGCSAFDVIVGGGQVYVVEAIAAVIADGKCCPCAVRIVVIVVCEAVTMLVIFLTSTFMESCSVKSTSLARTSKTLRMVSATITMATISVFSCTTRSMTCRITVMMTTLIKVVRAAMASFSARITRVGKSSAGNNGALRVLATLVVEALHV
jgi:hypothetical protein